MKSGIVLAIGDEGGRASRPATRCCSRAPPAMEVRLGGEPVLIVAAATSSRASAESPPPPIGRGQTRRPAARTVECPLRRCARPCMAIVGRTRPSATRGRSRCPPSPTFPPSRRTTSAGAAPGTVQQRAATPRRLGRRPNRPLRLSRCWRRRRRRHRRRVHGNDGSTTTTTASAARRAGQRRRPRRPPPPVTDGAAAKTIEQIYRAAAPGVVQVNQGDAEGSGFVLDRQGDVVTNAHVVTNGGPVTVRSPTTTACRRRWSGSTTPPTSRC